MLYLTLLRNQWRQVGRSYTSRYRWLAFAVLLLIGIYAAALLIFAGFYFGEAARTVFPGRRPVALLNTYLLNILLALFLLRFFLQRTPRVQIQPYLHLPVSRPNLVRYFQLVSLASVHNLFPLFFFVPFWWHHLLNDVYPARGALLWLLGVVLLLILANYLNNLLRTLLNGGTPQMLLVAGVLTALLFLDQAGETLLMNRGSALLFDALLAGDVRALFLLILLVGAVYLYASRLLRQRLLDEHHAARSDRLQWRVAFAPEQGQAMNLLLLELTLMWRNKRPRTYFFLSLFFGTVYTAFFMADTDASESSLLSAFIGTFASGMFAMNYGQLLFAWESSYFDGLLARAVDLRSMIFAKLLLLQGSCVVFFFITLPLFYWLAPGLVQLHIAFLYYNAGITCMLMMALAVGNQKRVDLSKNGGFFNYEGFSAVHWLWFIPTILPPTLIFFLFKGDRDTALLIIGGLGVTSLLCTRLWSIYFARLLVTHRHAMASGFRRND